MNKYDRQFWRVRVGSHQSRAQASALIELFMDHVDEFLSPTRAQSCQSVGLLVASQKSRVAVARILKQFWNPHGSDMVTIHDINAAIKRRDNRRAAEALKNSKALSPAREGGVQQTGGRRGRMKYAPTSPAPSHANPVDRASMRQNQNSDRRKASGEEKCLQDIAEDLIEQECKLTSTISMKALLLNSGTR